MFANEIGNSGVEYREKPTLEKPSGEKPSGEKPSLEKPSNFFSIEGFLLDSLELLKIAKYTAKRIKYCLFIFDSPYMETCNRKLCNLSEKCNRQPDETADYVISCHLSIYGFEEKLRNFTTIC